MPLTTRSLLPSLACLLCALLALTPVSAFRPRRWRGALLPNKVTVEIEVLEADIRTREKAARDLEAEAAEIDAAVFDLKAVNPNAVTTADARTPEEILVSIQEQGRILADALTRLKALLATAG